MRTPLPRKDLSAWQQCGILVQLACFIHILDEYVAGATMCLGPSMLPTFNQEGDIVLVEHFSNRYNRLKYGDVVIAKSPNEPKLIVCKRIIGMPGDVVDVRRSNSVEFSRQITVKPGHVWLQGDNLRNSNDSRNYGSVPIGLVRGKVIMKLWPLTEAGFIRSGPPPEYRFN